MGDKKPTSLQLDLMSDGQLELVREQGERARGIFTGARLRAQDPDRFKVVLELLADDRLSVRAIAKLTRTSRNLVAVIKRDEQAAIEPLKKKLAGDYFHISQLCNERMIEMLNDPEASFTLQQLAIAGGTAFDKAQLASGGPTSRHERTGSEPTHQDLLGYLADLQREADQGATDITAEVDPEPAPGRATGSLPAGDQGEHLGESSPTDLPANNAPPKERPLVAKAGSAGTPATSAGDQDPDQENQGERDEASGDLEADPSRIRKERTGDTPIDTP